MCAIIHCWIHFCAVLVSELSPFLGLIRSLTPSLSLTSSLSQWCHHHHPKRENSWGEASRMVTDDRKLRDGVMFKNKIRPEISAIRNNRFTYSLVIFFFFFFSKFIYLFIYFWLCWVFASVRGLSLVAASGGHPSSRCAGLSPSRPLSRRAGSVVVAHGPSCSAARGIFPDQGLNPCPLYWQADSQPLRHQGSRGNYLFIYLF